MPETMNHTASGKLGDLWCNFMHDSPMWPIHGEYQCRTCGRHYPVPWAGDAAPRIQRTQVASFRSASLLLWLLLGAVTVSTVRAADAPVVVSNTPAGMALARYAASLDQASPWDLETIEIDASLPKFEKTGRLRAIRRLLPLGKPEYQVLEIAGDQTVRQQVIVRYLSAEVRAAGIPASAVAITPANYKFRYNLNPAHSGLRGCRQTLC